MKTFDQGRKSTQMVLETTQQRFLNAGGPHPPEMVGRTQCECASSEEEVS